MIPLSCKRQVALEMAAGYRHDVKKFCVGPNGDTYTSVKYDGTTQAGDIVWDSYHESRTMKSILDDLIGTEPRLKNEGTRPASAMAQRKTWHECRLAETVE